MKKKTLGGYIQNMRFFTDWMAENYNAEKPVNAETAEILREYILWCANDKEYYGGRPFKSDYG